MLSLISSFSKRTVSREGTSFSFSGSKSSKSESSSLESCNSSVSSFQNFSFAHTTEIQPLEVLKIWNGMLELEATYTTESGNGSFNDILTVIDNIILE